jgi:hypothetical protein
VDAGLFGRKREFANDVAGSGNDADRIRVARSRRRAPLLKSVGTIIGGIRAATRAVGWDRGFESGFLQRRVRHELGSRLKMGQLPMPRSHFCTSTATCISRFTQPTITTPAGTRNLSQLEGCTPATFIATGMSSSLSGRELTHVKLRRA